MPPRRIESRQATIRQEGKIILTLQIIRKGQIKSIQVGRNQYCTSLSLFALFESAVLKRAYGRFATDLTSRRYSGIDKIDF